MKATMAGGKTVRALILQDRDEDAERITRELRRGGYQPVVRRACSVLEFDDALASGPWDGVVSAFRLENFSALAALAHLQRRGDDLPFIVVTPQASGGDASIAAQAGAHDFLLEAELARLVPSLERELAEAAERRFRRLVLREQEARARVEQLAAERDAILRQMAEAVIIANPDGVVVFSNDAAQQLYGADLTNEPLEHFPALFQTVGRDGRVIPWDGLALAQAIKRRETVITAEERLLRRDGSEVSVEGNAMPVLGGDGELMGAVLTMRDVSSQRNAELAKNEFLAAVAHDLKTPVTSIKGFTQMLQRRILRDRAEDSLDLLAGLDRIDATTNRITALVNQLLDLTRIQMGEAIELDRRLVDLVSLVQQVVDEQHANATRHRLDVSAPETPVLGLWDQPRLERVVTNLLSNAIKYSPNGGDISVTVTRVEGTCPMAVLAVTDRGLGIPAADLEHVFERFRRGSNVRGRIPGTGIGLSGAYHIVEQHGGSMTVSTVEGEGSVFTVQLPLTPGRKVDPSA